MPRSEEQNKNIRDKRKKKILEKTLQLCAIKGLSSVTIDEIAEYSNCSHGLFYHYFTSKDQIYDGIEDMIKTDYPEWNFPAKEALAAGGIKGLKVITDFCESVADAPADIVYLSRIHSMKHYTELLTDKALAKKKKKDGLIYALIQQGQKEGTVRDSNPKELACAFLDMINGACYRLIVEGKENFVPLKSDTMLSVFKI